MDAVCKYTAWVSDHLYYYVADLCHYDAFFAEKEDAVGISIQFITKKHMFFWKTFSKGHMLFSCNIMDKAIRGC